MDDRIKRMNQEYEEEKFHRQINPVLPTGVFERMTEYHISPYGIRGYICLNRIFDDKETSLENLQAAWVYSIVKNLYPKED